MDRPRPRPDTATAALAVILCCLQVHMGMGREVAEKTPTPCKAEYDKDFIGQMAEKYIADIPANQASPHLLLLLGGSGAGKGTFVKFLTKNGFPAKEYVMHGIDDYLEMLPEWRETAKDASHVFKDAADGCYGGAIPIARAAQSLLIERKMHAIYEETGKNLDRVLKRVIPPFKDAGYSITVALVDSTPEIAKIRAEGRFLHEGRYSSPEYVDSTFKNVFENYLALRSKGLAGEVIYCDNGCSARECMRCWDDSAPGQAGGGIVPASSLEKGQVRYMSRDAKPARDEI